MDMAEFRRLLANYREAIFDYSWVLVLNSGGIKKAGKKEIKAKKRLIKYVERAFWQ